MSDELAVQFCDKSGNIAVQFCDKSGNIGVQFCHPPAPDECPCVTQEDWDKLVSGEIEECNGLLAEYTVHSTREVRNADPGSPPCISTENDTATVKATSTKCYWKIDDPNNESVWYDIRLSLQPTGWQLYFMGVLDSYSTSGTGALPPDGNYPNTDWLYIEPAGDCNSYEYRASNIEVEEPAP